MFPPTPKDRPQGVRALSGGSLVDCAACGKPLTLRQQQLNAKSCSAKCRAALSRKRKADALSKVRGHVEAALRGLNEVGP